VLRTHRAFAEGRHLESGLLYLSDEGAAQREGDRAVGESDVFCQQCGAPNSAGARFCSSCGQPIAGAGPVRDPTPAAAATASPPSDRWAIPEHIKNRKPIRPIYWIGGIVAAIVAVSVIGALSPPTSTDSGSAKQAAVQSDPDPTPEPTPRPVSRQEQKRDFLQTVDESISGARIAGNPYKFVGTRVDLHCVVDDVPQENFINATCPPNDYGFGPNIVVETDSHGLEKGQRVRVIGTVADPMEGTNAMGGAMRFPTVKAEFME